MDATTQFALAYALTTSAGLRGFLTLLAASVAAHLGWIHPSASFAWLGSSGAMIVLAVFSALELLGDKIPVVDHALHAVYFAVRPTAAAILVGGTLHTDSPSTLYAAMALGAANALVVHGSSATARAATTAATFGTGNLLVSIIEDAIAVGGVILAFFAPVLAAVLALILVAGLVLSWRTVLARRRAHPPP